MIDVGQADAVDDDLTFDVDDEVEAAADGAIDDEDAEGVALILEQENLKTRKIVCHDAAELLHVNYLP